MSVTAKLLKLYNLYPKQVGPGVTLVPGMKTQKGDLKKVPLNPEYQRLLDKYLMENLDNYTTLKDRIERYKDLEFIRYNVAIMGRAIQMYADETIQPDSQNQFLNVYAKDREMEKYIKKFFADIGINQQVLLGIAMDLSLYGDHFWHHTIDPKLGITGITPLEVRAVVDRVEFNAMRVLDNSLTKEEMDKYISRSEVLLRIADVIRSKDESSGEFFKNYLFGYQLHGGLVVPPWSITHFRREHANSEFAPYGRPLMINAISPARQLQTAKALMQVARAANFPIKHFEVTTDPGQGPAQQWESVNAAIAEFQNLGQTMTLKEQPSVGNEIWSPKGLLSLQVLPSQINMDQIGDVELYNEDMILASGVPRGYVDPSAGGWGDSGKSLTMQHKLFGRGVYTNQTGLLEGLTALVRLQFTLTGKYSADADFELSLNYPAVERSQDQIRQQQDTLQLAGDVLERMAQVMGLEPTDIPTDIVKDVFGKLSFIAPDQLDVWLTSLQNVRRDKFIQGGGAPGGAAPGGMDMGLGGGMGGGMGGDMGLGGADMGLGGAGGGTGPEGIDLNSNVPPEGGGMDDVLDGIGNTLDGLGFGDEEGKKSGGVLQASRIRMGMERLRLERAFRKRDKVLREKVKKRLNEEVIREAYFTSKRNRMMQESCSAGRHFYGSWSPSQEERLMCEAISHFWNAEEGAKLYD